MNVQAENILDRAASAIAKAEIDYALARERGARITIKRRNYDYAMAVIKAINIHMTTMENCGATSDDLVQALAEALEALEPSHDPS